MAVTLLLSILSKVTPCSVKLLFMFMVLDQLGVYVYIIHTHTAEN
jgi:hypothetical protein